MQLLVAFLQDNLYKTKNHASREYWFLPFQILTSTEAVNVWLGEEKILHKQEHTLIGEKEMILSEAALSIQKLKN